MGVLGKLGDRLLNRLVPKTVARACEAGTMATWTEFCWCKKPHGYNESRKIYKVCDNCGGTQCSACTLIGSPC